MQIILCPVDFNNIAESAIDYAINIAANFQSQVIFLSVVRPGVDEQSEHDKAEERLKEIVSRVCKGLEERFTSYQSVVLEGPLVKSILRYIEQEDVDLVVMGTHGVEDSENSYTWEIIEKTECRVLSVPLKHHYSGIENIVYASNLDSEDRENILDLISLATAFNAHVKVLHYDKPGDTRSEAIFKTFKDEMLSFTAYSKLSMERKSSEGQTWDDLHEYMKHNSGDILGILYHQRSFLGQILHKSLTRQLSQYNEFPLLIYPKD
jgi:hypothetical protein